MKVYAVKQLCQQYGSDTTLGELVQKIQGKKIHKCPKCNGTGFIAEKPMNKNTFETIRASIEYAYLILTGIFPFCFNIGSVLLCLYGVGVMLGYILLYFKLEDAEEAHENKVYAWQQSLKKKAEE